MRNIHWLLKAFSTIGLILTLGVSLSADAGLFGFGGDSWKEEVLLHDGQKIVVTRSQTYGGRHDPGDSPPVKDQSITFSLPGTSKSIIWNDATTEDIGHANFDILALHIKNNTPYIVASPNLCISYNKWGNPTPPYIFFKYIGKAWQQISLSEFPVEFSNINLVINTESHAKELVDYGVASVELVNQLNSSLRQAEYITIIREPISNGCPKLERIEGGWQTPGGPKLAYPIPSPQPK
ncbi:hypothetical protein [Sulfurirhabdus autotrophica]|uniref:Uncharacterized protein n=1 Tax=Sulfurirhabdus autotrophica TaxID=1706046 RepID=A0A4R3XXF1_9PROT|nr:hypothetical protein [Sulfurirhabdus autotrophica]TCV83697.1 hypothetical protein EDC63_1141 [Sulfurirhabdus autotrophica]